MIPISVGDRSQGFVRSEKGPAEARIFESSRGSVISNTSRSLFDSLCALVASGPRKLEPFPQNSIPVPLVLSVEPHAIALGTSHTKRCLIKIFSLSQSCVRPACLCSQTSKSEKRASSKHKVWTNANARLDRCKQSEDQNMFHVPVTSNPPHAARKSTALTLNILHAAYLFLCMTLAFTKQLL